MQSIRSLLNTGHRGKHSLMCLLLLAVVVRMMVPVGYMPDQEALKRGQIALAFCSFAWPTPVTAEASAHSGLHGHHASHASSDLHAAGGDRAHPSSHDGHAEAAPLCPLGGLLAQAALTALPPQIDSRQLFFADASVTVLDAPPLVHSLPVGPPLGSRAPPAAIG